MHAMQRIGSAMVVAAAVALGCESTGHGQHAHVSTTSSSTAATSAPAAKGTPYDKPGFVTELEPVGESTVLWVMREGQHKAEKHISMIAAGPGRMTLRAVDRQTALEYLVAKRGFTTHLEPVGDSHMLWVLAEGQQPSEKHISMVAAGPMGLTIRAIDKPTALSYIAAREGFTTHLEPVGDSHMLWVLAEGQQPSEKHISMVAAGPRGLTIRAVDKATALAYIAARPGFETRIETVGDRPMLWVLKPGDQISDKHVTRVAAGPRGLTVKAVDRDTIDAYLGTRAY